MRISWFNECTLCQRGRNEVKSLPQMMLLWMCTCTESQKKGTAAPQLYFGGITGTQNCTVLCSEVSTFSFPTFAHRKQGCKVKNHKGCLRKFLLNGGYFAAQKHPSSNAFWLARNFYVEPYKTHKDYSGRVSIDHVQLSTQGLQKKPLDIKQE